MPDAQQLEKRLNDFISEHNLKQTRQRQVIFEAFLEAGGDHIGVDELLARVQEKLPGIGYATVYRTLKLFADAGVAHVRRFGENTHTVYEPVEIGEHHDHLICQTCGHIFEFEDQVIEQRQREVAAAHGLRIVRHHHEVFGECKAPESCAHKRAREASR